MQPYNYFLVVVSVTIFLVVSVTAGLFLTESTASILLVLVDEESVVDVLSVVLDLQAPKEITADTAKIVKSFFMCCLKSLMINNFRRKNSQLFKSP